MNFLGFHVMPRRIPSFPVLHSWKSLSSIGSGIAFPSFHPRSLDLLFIVMAFPSFYLSFINCLLFDVLLVFHPNLMLDR